MYKWKTSAALAGIREADSLRGLSAEEHGRCEKFWRDVEDVLRAARGRSVQGAVARGFR